MRDPFGANAFGGCASKAPGLAPAAAAGGVRPPALSLPARCLACAPSMPVALAGSLIMIPQLMLLLRLGAPSHAGAQAAAGRCGSGPADQVQGPAGNRLRRGVCECACAYGTIIQKFGCRPKAQI